MSTICEDAAALSRALPFAGLIFARQKLLRSPTCAISTRRPHHAGSSPRWRSYAAAKARPTVSCGSSTLIPTRAVPLAGLARSSATPCARLRSRLPARGR
jgi:hypothetical protein